MLNKKFGIVFGIFFLLAISFVSVSAATCQIVEKSLCNDDNQVLNMYDITNSHVNNFLPSTIDIGQKYDLCCDFVGTHECNGNNTVIRIYPLNNSHAEIPNLDPPIYTEDVCFGNLECIGTTDPAANISDYPIEMISLTSATNAHVGGYSNYTYKILCRNSLISSGIYWMDYIPITAINEANFTSGTSMNLTMVLVNDTLTSSNLDFKIHEYNATGEDVELVGPQINNLSECPVGASCPANSTLETFTIDDTTLSALTPDINGNYLLYFVANDTTSSNSFILISFVNISLITSKNFLPPVFT